MLRAYAVALSSLLSGAAAVHAVYQPDLVRWGGAARLRGRRRRTWQRGRGSLRGARAPCAPLCCAGAARGGGAQMCVVRYPCRAAGCGAERYRARAASQGKPRWPPFPPRRGQRVAPGACLALGDARRPAHSVSDVISSVSSWPRCSAAAAHAAQRGGDLATQTKKSALPCLFRLSPRRPCARRERSAREIARVVLCRGDLLRHPYAARVAGATVRTRWWRSKRLFPRCCMLSQHRARAARADAPLTPTALSFTRMT